jgi:hypothetical protein
MGEREAWDNHRNAAEVSRNLELMIIDYSGLRVACKQILMLEATVAIFGLGFRLYNSIYLSLYSEI